ncbi:MAG TPA: alpha/beta fold hydrolase [Solirubrobacterales bacterium]|nr:alpha/beta fold hydrolase [Solirubrobacterales bacterium]
MPTLEARGVELAWSERGEGEPVLLVHETAATGSVWDAVADALTERARAITYDRRGWGASSAPEGYRRTTVEEQSEDAVALLESAAAAPAVVIGAGVGAIVALDLLLRRHDLVAGMLLVEPPILQMLPVATEALSEDRRRLEMAAATGESVIDLYLSGGLPSLGAEVVRLPDEFIAPARQRPASVVAEMGIATGWRAPLPSLAAAESRSLVVVAASTPPIVRDASAVLVERLAGADLREVGSGTAPPHLGAAAEVAALALELSP